MSAISVLIPMYNRKHYIAQAIDSVFNQTFQDFELIVRDDGSTDGSADFVAEKYADAIKSGKLKLRRNGKNIGQFLTDNRLLREATGKYVMVLHSDDLYLPYALEHMYKIAEQFQADVVHECKHLTTDFNGVIKKDTPLKISYYDKLQVKDVTVMPTDPAVRFSMWLADIGIDAQHNIFNRQFILENDLCFETFGGNRLLAFKWLMRAKVLVKTPISIYIYRDSPDSQSRSKVPPERVAKYIAHQFELSRHLDEYFAMDDFFKDNPELQYLARSNFFQIFDNRWINKHVVYRNGITPELHAAVEAAFREHFGKDAAFPTFLFHWVHAALCGQPATVLNISKA